MAWDVKFIRKFICMLACDAYFEKHLTFNNVKCSEMEKFSRASSSSCCAKIQVPLLSAGLKMQSLLVHDVHVVQWVSKVKETLLEVTSSQLLHYFLSP